MRRPSSALAQRSHGRQHRGEQLGPIQQCKQRRGRSWSIRNGCPWCAAARGAIRRTIPLAGEAWPGTPMDWEIERRGHDGGASDGADGTTWRTRISIELPSLGRVDAELSLNSQQLSARIKAAPAGAAMLLNGSADFRRRAARPGSICARSRCCKRAAPRPQPRSTRWNR